MGDWEDFCGSQGMDVGSEDHYDNWVDGLNAKPPPRRFIHTNTELVFDSLHDAAAWSRNNGGAAFTRTSDGKNFTPVKK